MCDKPIDHWKKNTETKWNVYLSKGKIAIICPEIRLIVSTKSYFPFLFLTLTLFHITKDRRKRLFSRLYE